MNSEHANISVIATFIEVWSSEDERDLFILNTKPQNISLLNISHPKDLTLYLYTPCLQKNKWVWWPKRKPVNQNHCCFIISDIILTFQWSYNLISLWTLRQHCLPFVKTLIYTLPSIMGPWGMTGTHRHCSNTATQQFLFRTCLCFMHKYTWIYITQVHTYFQRTDKHPSAWTRI